MGRHSYEDDVDTDIVANDLKAGIKEALKRELIKRGEKGVVEVTSFEDITVYGGFCDTCSYEETVLKVSYTDSDNQVNTFEFSDKFENIIKNLTDWW